VRLVETGTVSSAGAKKVFELMLEEREEPERIVEEHGLAQVSDADELANIVRRVLSEHPAQVEQYRAGKQQVAGFLVGQVMKATHGRANPQLVNELVRKGLAE
jgi:aspartyl-tRNA(Asn)/glutamyl-tRNA(Gln) amidotransferase subunit B